MPLAQIRTQAETFDELRSVLQQIQQAFERVTYGSATLTDNDPGVSTATVATTKVTASSLIFVLGNDDDGTPGWLRVSGRTPGTSFTVTSSAVGDTSTFAWLMIEP